MRNNALSVYWGQVLHSNEWMVVLNMEHCRNRASFSSESEAEQFAIKTGIKYEVETIWMTFI